MSLEKHYSLGQAAKTIGISRATLKKWLAEDMAMVLPNLDRGQKVLIRESDLELMLRRRRLKSNFALLRGGRKAAS